MREILENNQDKLRYPIRVENEIIKVKSLDYTLIFLQIHMGKTILFKA